MRTFDEYNQELNEKKDLSKFKVQMLQLIADNQDMTSRLLAATLTEDKRLIEIVKAINNIVDYNGSNPIHEYTQKIYTRIHELGRKKYGKEDWNANIYNPQED